MIKVTSQLVLMFEQDGEPVGLLHENGKGEVYVVRRANKNEVAALFEADKVDEVSKNDN